MDEIEYTTSKLMKWMDGEKPGPLTIELLFGDGCNQNCIFCPSYNGKNKPLGDFNLKNELTKDEYIRIIDESAKLGTKRIQLSGDGEPLFDKKKSMSVMKRIKKHNMHGFLNTNGVLLIEKDIKTLVEIGWDMILISLESPNAKLHDYLVRLPGAFDKVVHNIRRFNYWKQKLKKDKPEIELKMLLTNENYEEIEDMVLLSHRLNVHLRLDSLIVFHSWGESLKLDDGKKNDFRKHLNRAIKLSENSHLRFNISDEIFENTFSKYSTSNHSKRRDINKLKKFMFPKVEKNKFLSSSCYLPWLRVLIGTTGFVGPCGFSITKENVKNKKLEEIWFGDVYNELRNDRLSQKLGKECSICADIEYNHNIRNCLINRVGEWKK